MSTVVRVPLTLIRVEYRASARRPITELDRLVMQAIAREARSVSELKDLFELPERLLVESLIDLMNIGLVALETNGNGFLLTEFGDRNLEQGLRSFGEQLCETELATFLRENLTGCIASSRIVTYNNEEGNVSPSTGIRLSIPRGTIERLLIQDIKKDGYHFHLYSVESVTPVRDRISFPVSVDKGGVTGLPGKWSHLQQKLMEAASKQSGVNYISTCPREREAEPEESYWTEVSAREEDLLLTVADHVAALTKAIDQAKSHLLILSAHVAEATLEKLTVHIVSAIGRDVRVDVLWGLPSLEDGGPPHARMTKDWLSKVRRSSQDPKSLLTVNESPLDSDAKIVIWDSEDGAYHAIVSSYNWLFGLNSSSAESHGADVGVQLNDPRCVGNICSTLAGWIKESGQQLSGIALRWSNIGLRLATTDLPSSLVDGEKVMVRIIYDDEHAGILSEGLWNASNRLLISSHKINRISTGDPKHPGRLVKLAENEKIRSPEFRCIIISGKHPKSDSWNEDDQKCLEDIVKRVGGTLRLGDGTHARVLVYDNVCVVSSFNYLSTTRDSHHIGVMFRGEAIANALWKTFEPVLS